VAKKTCTPLNVNKMSPAHFFITFDTWIPGLLMKEWGNIVVVTFKCLCLMDHTLFEEIADFLDVLRRLASTLQTVAQPLINGQWIRAINEVVLSPETDQHTVQHLLTTCSPSIAKCMWKACYSGH
ncbi:hypothetical protein ACJX0J_016180, partial [Zea mays]